MSFELLSYSVNHKRYLLPVVKDEVRWVTERAGSPGRLEFSYIRDSALKLLEGDPVRFTVGGRPVFYGYLFSKRRDSAHEPEVVCYDQLRYFKNRDTLVYQNLTAGGLVKRLAQNYGLKTGALAATGYVIAQRVEDNVTLFDMVQNALDLTLLHTGRLYVLYDEFGRLRLANIAGRRVDFLVDADTAGDMAYTSSIDEATYNQVKLAYDNPDTGRRDIYLTKNSQKQNRWGLLQHYDKLDEGENGVAKAEALLKLYAAPTRTLTVKRVAGDLRVRAGCMVYVQLHLGDMKYNNYMLVERAAHTFRENEHVMDLTLRGGRVNDG